MLLEPSLLSIRVWLGSFPTSACLVPVSDFGSVRTSRYGEPTFGVGPHRVDAKSCMTLTRFRKQRRRGHGTDRRSAQLETEQILLLVKARDLGAPTIDDVGHGFDAVPVHEVPSTQDVARRGGRMKDVVDDEGVVRLALFARAQLHGDADAADAGNG